MRVATMIQPRENKFAKYLHADTVAVVLGAFILGMIVANGWATREAVHGSEQYYRNEVVAPLQHKVTIERKKAVVEHTKAVTATKDKEAICNVAVANGDIQTLTDAKRCMPELGKP